MKVSQPPALTAVGYAAVNGGSGAVFALEGMSKDQKALVITNGHLSRLDALRGEGGEYPRPGESVFELGGERVAEHTSILVHGPNGPVEVKASKLIFATMTGTDLAIFELEDTYRTLEAKAQVRPAVLDREAPEAGDRVDVVSGYYGKRQGGELGERVWLREGPYTTTDGVRLDPDVEIWQGWSGSLLVNEEGRFVGLANTHSSGEGETCSLHNPCELDPASGDRRATASGQAYGVVATDLYLAYDEARGALDFNLPTSPWRPK